MDYNLREKFFIKLTEEINSIIDKKTGKVSKKYLKKINCPICKVSDFEESLFEKNGFDFVRCKQCELIYTNPQPKVDLIEKIYKNSESSEIWRKLQGSNKEIVWKKDYYYDSIDFISKNINISKKIKLLDLGCNNGLFLEYVREKTNWDHLGIDLNEKAIDEAKRKKLNVINCDYDILDREFDIVTMFGVMEHIPNPYELLEKIILKQKNKNKWYFSMIVPNMFSLFHFFLKENSPSIDGREHILYFSINSIKNLLKKLGFNNIICDTILTGEDAIKQQLQWYKYDSLGAFDMKFIPSKILEEIENGNFEKFLKKYDLGLRLRVIAKYEN